MRALAVAICTYNPNPDVLKQCFQALEAQALPMDSWHLLVVDNNSPTELTQELVGWHPNARLVKEEEQGLTAARLRSLCELDDDLIVFVDDDNVLDTDYLANVLEIAQKHPCLGAFGGRATPVYEVEPTEELRQRADFAALKRDVRRPSWGNAFAPDFLPFGAGMVIRRSVGRKYLELLRSDSVRRGLDRVGNLNMFCGDCDLAWCSLDLGMGCGVFPELHFQHLTPAKRVSKDYLLNVAEASAYSWLLLHRVRGIPHGAAGSRMSFLQHLRHWRAHWKSTPLEREFRAAELRGIQRALAADV